MLPLNDLSVLDLSADPSGRIAAMILAEAGARLIDGRGWRGEVGDQDAAMAQSVAGADIVVTSGVVASGPTSDRQAPAQLVARIRAMNPEAILCMIVPFGLDGPKAGAAAGPLLQWSETGLLSRLAADAPPSPPPTGISQIGAGAYPAVINILLALRERDRTGVGATLTIAIADSLHCFAYDARSGDARYPDNSSPRYALYRTQDGRYVAVEAVETRLWENLCERLELDEALRDPDADPAAIRVDLAAIFGSRSAKFWREKFENRDLGCAIVADFDEAIAILGYPRPALRLTTDTPAPGLALDDLPDRLPLATDRRRS